MLVHLFKHVNGPSVYSRLSTVHVFPHLLLLRLLSSESVIFSKWWNAIIYMHVYEFHPFFLNLITAQTKLGVARARGQPCLMFDKVWCCETHASWSPFDSQCCVCLLELWVLACVLDCYFLWAALTHNRTRLGTFCSLQSCLFGSRVKPMTWDK